MLSGASGRAQRGLAPAHAPLGAHTLAPLASSEGKTQFQL